MLRCEVIERDLGGGLWSDAEVERLAAMYFATPKPAIEVMAHALGRTPKAIIGQISRSSMSARDARLRVCLGICGGRRFYSSWIGHRRCSSCSRSDELRWAS